MPADKLHITLAGSEHVVEEGTTAGLALADRDPEAASRSPPGSTASCATSPGRSPTVTASSRSHIDST